MGYVVRSWPTENTGQCPPDEKPGRLLIWVRLARRSREAAGAGQVSCRGLLLLQVPWHPPLQSYKRVTCTSSGIGSGVGQHSGPCAQTRQPVLSCLTALLQMRPGPPHSARAT